MSRKGLTYEQIEAILEEVLSVDDEWGGCKLANWKYGNNVVVAGIDEAVTQILELQSQLSEIE